MANLGRGTGCPDWEVFVGPQLSVTAVFLSRHCHFLPKPSNSSFIVHSIIDTSQYDVLAESCIEQEHSLSSRIGKIWLFEVKLYLKLTHYFKKSWNIVKAELLNNISSIDLQRSPIWTFRGLQNGIWAWHYARHTGIKNHLEKPPYSLILTYMYD
jgi:hypothetical protein